MKEHKLDRTKWHSGPWDNEVDRYEWRDESTNYPCLIVRNGSGGLCGYVGITEDHPEYEKDYNDIPVNVHGGVTYFFPCDGELICHVPLPGEKEVKWVGFDCVHSGDYAPGYGRDYFQKDAIYRDVEYVRGEITSLASQLKECE